MSPSQDDVLIPNLSIQKSTQAYPHPALTHPAFPDTFGSVHTPFFFFEGLRLVYLCMGFSSSFRINVIGRAKTSIKLASGKWIFPESLEGHCRQAHALQSSRMGSMLS